MGTPDQSYSANDYTHSNLPTLNGCINPKLKNKNQQKKDQAKEFMSRIFSSNLNTAPMTDSDPARGRAANEYLSQRLFPESFSLPRRFSAVAAASPQALAISDDEGAFTYRELDLRTTHLAGRLLSLGLGPEVLVGLCL